MNYLYAICEHLKMIKLMKPLNILVLREVCSYTDGLCIQIHSTIQKKKTGIAGRTVRLKRMVLDVMKLR